jgi:hypothetical protein
MTAPQAWNPNGAATSGDIARLAASIGGGKYPWWYPRGAYNKAIDYFVYDTDFLPLGGGLTVVNPIAIGADSAFVILSAVIVETDVLNTTFIAQPPLLFVLMDGGSGRSLSNAPIHATNWFGTAQLPKYWDVPKILAPNSTFTVSAQNLEAVNRNVRVAFHGLKIFAFSPTLPGQ